jgi:hypothetical protein
MREAIEEVTTTLLIVETFFAALRMPKVAFTAGSIRSRLNSWLYDGKYFD